MNNYDYPLGADNENAPWNKKDQVPLKKDVVISQTLSRYSTIEVTDYEICDPGEDEWYDFSNCNLEEAYNSQDYTIPMLLDYLKDYLKADIDKTTNINKRSNLKTILKACKGWNIDETEVIED